jgi:LmbE family N-acetylglucosaminyl deacetylase
MVMSIHTLLAQAERIMVIMAHPDDAEIQCGGTIVRLIDLDKQVTYVLCTNGNRGTTEANLTANELATIREAEQRAAASLLGVHEVVFLRYNDGDLTYKRQALRHDLVKRLRQYRPQVVFTHDPFAGIGSYEVCYLHPDHRMVGEVVLEAAFFCAPGPLFYPEQITEGLKPHKITALCLVMSQQPDLVVDIESVFENKVLAIAQHASQWGKHPDLKGFFREIAEGLGREYNIRLAEAFKMLKA